MTEEFRRLQFLLKNKKCEIRLKKHIKDFFGLWLHGVSVTKPSFWNFFGYASYIYMVLLSWIVWVPLTLFVSYKYDWLYFSIFFIPYLIKIILRPLGQRFLLADLQLSEDLFSILWSKKAIGICSTKNKIFLEGQNGVPEVIIDPDIGIPHFVDEWKIHLVKIENLN